MSVALGGGRGWGFCGWASLSVDLSLGPHATSWGMCLTTMYLEQPTEGAFGISGAVLAMSWAA
eukprot:7280080-Pyramimonas_sp.AAC.1